MGNSPTDNNFIGIMGIILSAISIIVGILLVKDAREYFSKKIGGAKVTVITLWAQFWFQALTFLILGFSLLIFSIISGGIALELGLALAIILLIIFLMLNSLNSNTRKLVRGAEQELDKITVVVNRLTEIEKIELKIVKDKWGIFLEQVSSNISLTAVHNVLVLSEPFAVNDHSIVIRIPDILEPSMRNLSNRLKDVEPILNKIYEKPYKLVVHAKEKIQ
jgi:hypothetical protein